MTDLATQRKWDRAAPTFDLMAGAGAEKRWGPFKLALFSKMDGRILFVALGTGLDIEAFPPGQTIRAIDISPKMLDHATKRVAAYPGDLRAEVMDVHNLTFDDDSFDQIFTSCTFCSVPNPVEGLRSLKRVLRPGGDMFMFEHTGSRYYPFKLMMQLMTKVTSKIGPDMDRTTVANVRAAGFDVLEVDNLFLDVVKTIHAKKEL